MKALFHSLGVITFTLGVCTTPVIASKYYWVGNSGNWSNYAVHWATTSGGGSFHSHIPFATDTVYFDSNSFSLPSQAVTLDNTIVNCADMIWTGVTNNPILDGPITTTLKIYGSLVLDASITMNFPGAVSFNSTQPGNTITSAGLYFNNTVFFNGPAGSWTLMDSLSVVSPHGIVLNNGTLYTNDQTINAYSFQSLGVATRAVVLGNSVINLSAQGNAYAWRVSKAGMSVNCGLSNINCVKSASAIFDGGSFTYNDVSFTNAGSPVIVGIISNSGPCNFHDINFGGKGNITSNGNTFHNVRFKGDGKVSGKNNGFTSLVFDSMGTIGDNNNFNKCVFSLDGSITGSNSFDSLTFSPGHTYTLTAGQSQTIITALVLNGNGGFPIRIQSSVPGSPTTLYKISKYICADFILLSDIIATGGAIFNAGPNSADYGGNSGWNFPGNCLPPLTAFQVSNAPACANDCINFADQSVNADSWKWNFDGGNPSTSTQQNPQHICYTTAGTYNVKLIASNIYGNDTLTMNNYVVVNPSPPTPNIVQLHDTLHCSYSSDYISYQWFFDTTLIAGATDSFYVVMKGGNYNVQVTNRYGCQVAAGINVVGMQELFASHTFFISPNPVNDIMYFNNYHMSGKARISILNMLGEVLSVNPVPSEENSQKGFALNVNDLSPGIYFARIDSGKESRIARFVRK